MNEFDFPLPLYAPRDPIAYDNVSLDDEQAAQNEQDERDYIAAGGK